MDNPDIIDTLDDDDAALAAAAPECNICASDEFTILGHLGRRLWLRCRRCGHNQEVTNDA